MIYVALAEAVVIVVLMLSFAGILRWIVRGNQRREDQLVNQICHLAGRPWESAPSEAPFVDVEPPPDPRFLVAVPDQLPDS